MSEMNWADKIVIEILFWIAGVVAKYGNKTYQHEVRSLKRRIEDDDG